VIVDTRFVIAVPDLEQSAAFYRDVLEFEIREIGDAGWRMYVRDDCSILAGECPGAMPATELGDHSYFAYLVGRCGCRVRAGAGDRHGDHQACAQRALADA
jgi:catechol 2,3-dioxygenase-like lactoylglutathione lyase family enzyme